MNTAPWFAPKAPAAAWHDALLQLGFSPAAGGYQRAHLRIEPASRWWTLTNLEPGTATPEPIPDLLQTVGAPGPWKWLEADGVRRRSLVLPAALFDPEAQDGTDDEAQPVLSQLVDWAQETAAGRVPPGWQAPERQMLETWFRREDLTVVAGTLLRQGEVICQQDRFVLRFPILPQVPAELPPARRAWLQVLLEETQQRTHLVRCGFSQDADGTAAIVEVDLTGVPPAVSETLFVNSLEALRWAVQWLGEPADWLADATVVSELLAGCPNQEPKKGAP